MRILRSLGIEGSILSVPILNSALVPIKQFHYSNSNF